MRLGIPTFYTWESQDSIAHLREATVAVLRQRHELIPYPAELPLVSRPEQHRLLQAWVAQCDAIVGPVDQVVSRVRREQSRPIPWLCLTLGGMSRGATGLMRIHPAMYTYDVLVGNCAADAALAAKFFPNATVDVIPYGGIDDTMFYPDEAKGREIRESLGFSADDRILVYAGRITIEKNLHTLLKAFRVVLDAVPAACLVIAGDEGPRTAFNEFGVSALALKRMLRRLVAQLAIPSDRVRFIGHRPPDQLRGLYSAADVMVNLTLNHDENFGVAQVEAMACGLPVVGTSWGGLKDTIVDGVSGRQVPVLVTAAGVKVDWWEAANRITELLARDGVVPEIRKRCRTVVSERYTLARYGEHLERILASAVAAAAAPGPAEGLRPSLFAEGYWNACVRDSNPSSDSANRWYRRSHEAFALYREMIELFASPASSGHSERPAAWCLASPLIFGPNGTLTVNDPLYPLDVEVPPPLAASIHLLANRLAKQPVLAASSLENAEPALDEALRWMRDAGLVLPTQLGNIDMSTATSTLGQPLFKLHHVDSRNDVVWMS